MLVLVFGLLVLRSGWVVDDAYISFRTVDNIFAGHGPVWNVGERVQAYTHPLWLVLCCVVYGITDEFFYSVIVTGALISTAAMALVTARLARSELIAISLLLVALLSHAFVDYSTSGLENPLTHLLFALAAWVYLGRLPGKRPFGWLCLIGGLSLLSRPDNALLLGPVVIAAGIQAYRRGTTLRELWTAALVGGIPLFVWELFSLFYYGILVPNTALAKLNSGIPAGEMIQQGFFYLISTLDADPLTLVVILAGMFAPFVFKQRKMVPFAIGIALHLLYLIKIGGDFMLGRFLTAPMFMAIICLSQIRRVGLVPIVVIDLVLVALGLTAHPNTLENNSRQVADKKTARTQRKVTDERVLLHRGASLLSGYRTREMPDHYWWVAGLIAASEPERAHSSVALGFRGLAGGPEVHWIDKTALTDPLLSRLPAVYNVRWMAGHYIRAIPKGYQETIESGENQLENSKLRKLYDRIDVVTHGDLWSLERLEAIWWLNTGGPSRLINEESWRFYGASRRKPSSLRWRVNDGTAYDAKQVRSFGPRGVYVKYKDRHHHELMELSVNDDDRFELRFYDGSEEIARVPVPRARKNKVHGVIARRIELPEVLYERGFNRLRIVPRTMRRHERPFYAIGHLLFDEEIETAPHVSTKPGNKKKKRKKKKRKSTSKSKRIKSAR